VRLWGIVIYADLQRELEIFERRTPKSAESHKRSLKRIPLGVASNYRAYDPYPIFVKEGRGSHFRDLDGNDYIDHNLCFGVLMAGHCHPAVMAAVEKRLSTGTVFGMPHDMEWELAEEICTRFPVEMVRFGSSGTEAMKPDIICLAKAIGGGLPLAAFGASTAIMDLISQHKVFHGGTYNTNPVSMAAGLAMFREVLTRENYAYVDKLGKKLADGYRKTIAKVGLQGYVASAGVNGALMLYPREIRNYRDWTAIDIDLWRHYWFGMVNRGVMAQPYWWDEQWTISVQHTDADIDNHLAAFEDLAPALAKAQYERPAAVAVH
jgi:glutamate-1-semialdehyde aminotransferase